MLLDKIWALKPASMDELLYGIFFRRMPSYIRDVVHARNFETRQELAAICNKIWEERGGGSPPRTGVAAAPSHRPGAPSQGAPTDASREEGTGDAAGLQPPRPTGGPGRTPPGTATTTAPTGPTLATANHHAFRKTN